MCINPPQVSQPDCIFLHNKILSKSYPRLCILQSNTVMLSAVYSFIKLLHTETLIFIISVPSFTYQQYPNSQLQPRPRLSHIATGTEEQAVFGQRCLLCTSTRLQAGRIERQDMKSVSKIVKLQRLSLCNQYQMMAFMLLLYMRRNEQKEHQGKFASKNLQSFMGIFVPEE